MTSLKRITIFPIKSLDGVVVPAARILHGAGLEHDREFALVDAEGRWINGKRNFRVHLIRAEYDLTGFVVFLRGAEETKPRTFHLLRQHREIEKWFEDFLGMPVTMQRNTETGFPDDLEASGPTVIGSATLCEVGSWFGISDVDQVARRFRANLEIETEVPFWEDRLFGASQTTAEFHVGEVRILGVNPCQRCVVPTRNPSTAEAIPDFQRVFASKREETLPPWATKSRFNHYYRLAINTRIPLSEAGKIIHAGDRVEI